MLRSGAPARAKGPTAAGSALRFNGYGTVGVVHADNSQPGWRFTRDSVQAPDFRSLQTTTDSCLGLQVNLPFSPKFDAVRQAMLRQQDLDAGATPQATLCCANARGA